MFGIRMSISTTCGWVRAGELDGVGAVGGFGDDLHVGLVVDDHPKPAAYQRLIVGEQHADHRAFTRVVTAGVGTVRPNLDSRPPEPSPAGPAWNSPASWTRSRIPITPWPVELGVRRCGPSSETTTCSWSGR